MITTGDLRKLASFTAERTPVLSLYLDADLSRQLKDQVKLVLRDLLEQARTGGAAEADMQRAAHYVDLEYDWQGRGLVILSCLDDDLWEPLPLPVPVRSQVYLGDQAYLMPLSSLLDQYAPYGVALVDQERARLFLIDMGGVVKEENTIGDPIKHQKQGGWAAQRYQRHEDKIASVNLRTASAALARFCEANECSRLILAGTDGNTARFRGYLPSHLRQVVVGTMPMEMGATTPTIAERSREILADLDEKHKDGLVEQVITYARSGGAGVLGLADTLYALQEGRVLTLVVEQGFRAAGFNCPNCGYLSVDETQHCLFCGTAQALPVADVVERAVHKAILQGARLEVIAESPALAQAGHIGALLRY